MADAFKISESALQSAVIELAHMEGWLVHHTRPVQIRPGRWATPIQGDAGFPDLVLTHPTRGTIFAELKTTVGRLSEQQKEWIERLQASGLEAHVWRPRDIRDIRIRLGRKAQ